jgi:hypothetical protein
MCYVVENDRKKEFDSMMKWDKEKIINDFFVERDCKNQAYFFILDSRLLNEFKRYCQEKGYI